MKENEFAWVDLSSYNPSASQKFYEELFGWSFYQEGGYKVWFAWNSATSGLYETPDFFKSINMPHFWMGYIKVDDVEAVVEKARALGATIEIEKDAFYDGNIALIRDPLGAGFTVYDGDSLDAKKQKTGHFISNELQISDISKVKDFYEGIFAWDIKDRWYGEFEIYSRSSKKKIASILEVDSATKGKYEYWTVVFWVSDIELASAKVKELWWDIISQEVHRVLCSDNSGEAFFYLQKL